MNTEQHTPEQVRIALMKVAAVGDAIRELKEVPSGHLYARLIDHMSLEQYQATIATLERARLVKVESHVVKWIGPPVIIENNPTQAA